jgi:V8-like Glu-specific endopeptidase
MNLNNNIYIRLFRCSLFLLLLLIINCEGPAGPAGPPGGEASWETAVASYNDCVYLLGIIPTGENYAVQVGTGWAISPTQIMTNAHVAYRIYDLCRSSDYNSTTNKIVAVKNGTFTGQEATYELVDCSVHTSYNNINPFSPDFAIFTADTTQLSGYVNLPRDNNLSRALIVGQTVGTLGFPGELSASDMDGYQPIATFKNGTISAMRPYDQRTTPQSSNKNVIIQYNFNTTGGTSGSPVFDQSGYAVAIHNSGVSTIVKDASDDYINIGLGDLNFGIRIDERSDVMSMPYQVRVADFRNPDPTEYSSLSSGQYRIDFDWNSDLDFDLWIVVGGTQFLCCIHEFFDMNRAHIYPFVVHHGDALDYGPELATILRLTEEVKIYAYKYSNSGSFSASSTECEIRSSTGTTANITNPPSGSDQFWIIGTLSAAGEFTEINRLTDDDPMQNTINNTRAMLKDFDAPQTGVTILKKALK